MSMPLPLPFSHSPAFKIYQNLTMPPGALHSIFEPTLRMLAQQKRSDLLKERDRPHFSLRGASLLFAGDHEVAKNNPVSAFPQEVTAQMVLNFLSGGAAMAVLSRARGIPLHVCDVGVSTPYAQPSAFNTTETRDELANGRDFFEKVTYHNYFKNLDNFQNEKYLFGAHDLSVQDALGAKAYAQAFNAGQKVFEAALAQQRNLDYIILGEMGIGNTTPAAALIAWCLNEPVENCVGAGTGINQNQHAIKCKVIEAALARHKQTNNGAHSADPHKTLQSLGGFELAAMAGAALSAANAGVHILLDGVIATASLLPFVLQIPALKSWMISAHCGSEPAHILALQKMELEPLLRLQLRLGEGSGAALAAGLFIDAVKLLNEMATFDSAQISGSESV